jgi:phosphoribosylamine---glycine ligase
MNRFNVVVIGSGAREHALVRAIQRSNSTSTVYAIPGNPGIATMAACVDISIQDHASIAQWCRSKGIDLVVIGPEQPLCNGLSDALRSNGINVFGPSAAASQIESSKQFAKEIMAAANVPTASYTSFDFEQLEQARHYAEHHQLPLVIKANGLAAGKGVVVAQTHIEALQAVETLLSSAGSSIIIEQFLRGEELSVFAITDGTEYQILPPAQDHKRIGDGDTGANTGGMGAYAPAPLASTSVMEFITTSIIEPVLAEMRSRGISFVGCLYAGLMVHKDGSSSVVEFNCRFGDPETEAVLSIVEGDVTLLLWHAATGTLEQAPQLFATQSACTVIMAAGGYPGKVESGNVITIELPLPEGVHVDHAGTAVYNGQLTTNGGRVLAVTGVANTLQQARALAYKGVERVRFQGQVYRTDIASKGLKYE